MSSACNSEVKRTTDAYESEVQKTEVHTGPVSACDSVMQEDRGVSSGTTH